MVPHVRPGHPPLVSLRCTRRPLTLERRGRTRLASLGCGCVGGRRAVPRVRPGHPPLVSLRCTRRPLTLKRRGRTRLASMGCVCVGGRTAVPRSAPGIPRSFRCAALAAPLRWSEGGWYAPRVRPSGFLPAQE